MPDITTAFKRVPRWAWLTSAGVAIGGIAAYTLRNRGEAESEETADDAAITGYPGSMASSPVPGIVVPDINIPESGSGEQGWMEMHNAYLQGIQTMFDTLLNRPFIEAPSAVAPVATEIAPTGGGVASGERGGVVTAQPPPSQQPTPRPCCLYNGHPLSWWRNPNHNRRNNKWRWPDGAGYIHTRAFEGHKACDGGGSAGGSKREC